MAYDHQGKKPGRGNRQGDFRQDGRSAGHQGGGKGGKFARFDGGPKADQRGPSYGRGNSGGRPFGGKPGARGAFGPSGAGPMDRKSFGPKGCNTERRLPKPDSQQTRSARGTEWTPAPAPAFRPAPPKPPRAPEPRRFGPNGEFDTPYSREPENLLSGRNPIREALKADRDIEKMLVAKGDLTASARELVALARQKGIPVQVVDRARLDEITPHHQGVLAYASAYKYSTVESMLALAKEKNEPPFLVILDGITDPHNLGAIIRTAACVGAHGVIVPVHRAAGLTPAAVKASAGAVETIQVARVTNLVSTIKALKKEGIWIYAADMDGEDYRTLSMEAPMALLIGSEGEGISRLALETSDHKVKLPMYGGVESLNASVAAGVLMYAAVKNK